MNEKNSDWRINLFLWYITDFNQLNYDSSLPLLLHQLRYVVNSNQWKWDWNQSNILIFQSNRLIFNLILTKCSVFYNLTSIRADSSVGRAPDYRSNGCEFESSQSRTFFRCVLGKALHLLLSTQVIIGDLRGNLYTVISAILWLLL